MSNHPMPPADPTPPMPDRDPAFTDGWDAAFRSLGASTPEAQAALRELVRTALAFEGLARETDKEKDSQEVIGTIARGRYSQGAMIAAEALRRFARLATPPEEGR